MLTGTGWSLSVHSWKFLSSPHLLEGLNPRFLQPLASQSNGASGSVLCPLTLQVNGITQGEGPDTRTSEVTKKVLRIESQLLILLESKRRVQGEPTYAN